MGPSGVRAKIVENETLMIVTEGWGVAHLRAVAPALRHKGSRVLHVALYERAQDVYLRDELEAAADATLWITAQGEPIKPRRPQDRAATGNTVDIIRRYAAGEWGEPAIALEDVRRLVIQASTGTLRELKHARENELAPFFATRPETVASYQHTDPVRPEGRVRAVPAVAGGSAHRPTDQGRLRLLVAGPAARYRGPRQPRRPSGSEPLAGASDQALARPPARAETDSARIAAVWTFLTPTHDGLDDDAHPRRCPSGSDSQCFPAGAS